MYLGFKFPEFFPSVAFLDRSVGELLFQSVDLLPIFPARTSGTTVNGGSDVGGSSNAVVTNARLPNKSASRAAYPGTLNTRKKNYLQGTSNWGGSHRLKKRQVSVHVQPKYAG